MPIYAYKCSACGFAKDVLQKMSDPLLTDCPSCLQATFSKQVTAAGFQLKGSGWYVTDFRDGGSATATTAASPAATPVSTGDAPATAPAAATPAPAASSASPE
jgi:putative FmdB family regulatory protein